MVCHFPLNIVVGVHTKYSVTTAVCLITVAPYCPKHGKKNGKKKGEKQSKQTKKNNTPNNTTRRCHKIRNLAGVCMSINRSAAFFEDSVLLARLILPVVQYAVSTPKNAGAFRGPLDMCRSACRSSTTSSSVSLLVWCQYFFLCDDRHDPGFSPPGNLVDIALLANLFSTSRPPQRRAAVYRLQINGCLDTRNVPPAGTFGVGHRARLVSAGSQRLAKERQCGAQFGFRWLFLHVTQGTGTFRSTPYSVLIYLGVSVGCCFSLFTVYLLSSHTRTPACSRNSSSSSSSSSRK